MSVPSAGAGNKEEFQRYLEKAGVIDAMTKGQAPTTTAEDAARRGHG